MMLHIFYIPSTFLLQQYVEDDEEDAMDPTLQFDYKHLLQKTFTKTMLTTLFLFDAYLFCTNRPALSYN